MLDKIKDKYDVGDETLRNFRYQHAYGVILLTGAYIGKLSYLSIWCEHHDDILCERGDGKFDIFQIKTRGVAQGEWLITDNAIQKSLKKFCALHQKYEEHIGVYNFASNIPCREIGENIQDQKKLGKSPINFITAVRGAGTLEQLKEPYKFVLKNLSENIEQDENLLFSVLKKTCFRKGPSKDDFETVVSHDHIGNLPECRLFPKEKLNRIRDVLIAKVFSSSSLSKGNDSLYWYLLNPDELKDPELISKRIDIDYVRKIITDEDELAFEFISTGKPLLVPKKGRKPSKIKVKMEKGLLGDVAETMTRRALSAEEHLIRFGYKNSDDDYEKFLEHLSNTVKAECDDALIKSTDGKNINGKKMYNYVVENLREIANNHPEKVRNQDQNVLIGIVGLLTDECKVWWSEKFIIEE